jgi:phenazine biosynthesis protein phzE
MLPDLISSSFALIEKNGIITLHQGKVKHLDIIDDIHTIAKQNNNDVIFCVPFCSIRERGFESFGDEKILALFPTVPTKTFTCNDFRSQLPSNKIELTNDITPSLSDEEHISRVKQIQQHEIEGGNASQINFARIFKGKIKDYNLDVALSIYNHLLEPRGQYMTFLFAEKTSEGFHIIIGATPECHLEVTNTETVMMPIAGTLRKEDKDTFEYRLHQFLTDPKEINELYQVTDEELKMMGRICPHGGYFKGPYLKEIGNVIHTYYSLIGKRTPNPLEALRHTLHAPTVVGSPMESAAKIIKHYEGESRRYYGGEIGIYHYTTRPDAHEFGNLDTGILIRSAEIFEDGTFRVQAGGGIVRDSDPVSEAKETRAKASVILNVLMGDIAPTEFYLTDRLHTQYEPTLMHRNRFLSKFWMNDQSDVYENLNKKIIIINNEDDFAFMIKHVLTKLGCDVDVIDTFDFDVTNYNADIIILGPGPGDINDKTNKRMVKLLSDLSIMKQNGQSLLGVCLGIQALAVSEQIPVVRQKQSTQGLQKISYVMGDYHRLGYYNSFSPVFTGDVTARNDIELDLDEDGRIIAMRGNNFAGFQFHPESIMSETGKDLLASTIRYLSLK